VRPGSAVAGFLAGLALTGCAPAHEAHDLFAQMQNSDVEARQEAADRLKSILEAGDYEVFLRGARKDQGMMRVQSIIYLSGFTQPEARAALRGLLALEERALVPYNPIRMKPASEETDSRILVANLIARNGGDPEAAGVLLRGVDSTQPAEILTATCLALGALRDAQGLPFLREALRHPEGDVAGAAVQALGRIPAPETFEALKEAASHAVLQVRIDLLSALEARREPGVAELIMTIAASDPSPEVRGLAIQQLERHPAPTVVPFLIDHLRREAPVRDVALQTLMRITGQSLGTRPERWSRWWSQNRPGPAGGK
jgi:HEAT repeat protein